MVLQYSVPIYKTQMTATAHVKKVLFHVKYIYVEKYARERAAKYSVYTLPLQRFLMHDLLWVLAPTHSLPPVLGIAISHCRLRVRIPLPQVAVQLLHPFHAPQPPSTYKNHIYDSKFCIRPNRYVKLTLAYHKCPDIYMLFIFHSVCFSVDGFEC